jgi:Xaa-Pro aminopeptidase
MGAEDMRLFGYRRLSERMTSGMILTTEAFLSRPGVGNAGFENNFIVTATGVEVLDKTPMLYW